jgi:hypothetical protein
VRAPRTHNAENSQILLCEKMSIQLTIDKSGKIVFSTPSHGTVLDEKLENLAAWLAKQDGFKKHVISTTEPIKKKTHMAFEMRPGQGSLFPSKKPPEERGERDPQSTGKCICPSCHAALWLSGWTRVTQSAVKYISLALKPADEAAQVDTSQPSTPKDDIPEF